MPYYDGTELPESASAQTAPTNGGFLQDVFGGITDVIDGVSGAAGRIVRGAQTVYGASPPPAGRQVGSVVPEQGGRILGIEEEYVYIGIGLLVLIAILNTRK